MDPYRDNVVLHLPMDGPNGSRSFIDVSPSEHIISYYGDAQIKTDQWKFGGSSAYFDGSGGKLATTIPALGVMDFTIEFWAYIPLDAGTYSFLIQIGPDIGAGRIAFLYDNSTPRRIYVGVEGGNAIASTSTSAVEFEAWTHISLTRTASNWVIYINGSIAATGTSFLTYDISATELTIGARLTGTLNNFKGYIDDLRITKGVARYTEDFTPPGRLLIPSYFYPDYSHVETINSNAKVSDFNNPAVTAAVDSILIFDWDTGILYKKIIPESNGNWSDDIPAGQYGLTFIKENAQPITHGPYTITE